MSEVADRNIKRYTLSRWGGNKEGDRFCLLAVAGYGDTEDQGVLDKRDDLLETLAGEYRSTKQILECTLGNCDVRVIDDCSEGKRTRVGVCRAASYCLKEAFEAVPSDDGVEAGRARYQEVMNTCEGRSDKYNAGNFCPRLDCGLSAGVSIDGVPGTSGECTVELRSAQGTLIGDGE